MMSRSALLASVSALAAAVLIGVSACQSNPQMMTKMAASDGPANQGPVVKTETGDANLGRDVFRTETFGNEGFWTDAVRLPQGIKAAGVTPMQALKLGLQIDSDKLDAGLKAQLAAELSADSSGRTSKILNDPANTEKLVMAGAVMGMSPQNGKVGSTCALCHSMSDGSMLKVAEGGSIGKRLDGLANNDLNIGKIFATAANTRALYTVAQLQLTANNGKTLGRAPKGLTETSTEAEFDAYFSNPKFYPIGMFDDSFDGNGDPMHNVALFRQDLAAPYGSEGTLTKQDDFANLVYTTLLDQTNLTTPGGRAFVHKLAGAAGDEMLDDYVKILKDTGVTGYPYVVAKGGQKVGELASPVGYRVDNAKLIAMNAYLFGLQAPAGVKGDAAATARGREAFRTSGCTGCHNVDQSKPVPSTMHPMAEIFPGDKPVTLAQREPPLTPVLDTPGYFFDDKLAVVNASIRGDIRGIAMPMLLDLARKPKFLHDDTVGSLDALLSPNRGASAPHPFYLNDARTRADVIVFLKGMDTSSR